jgi:small-conductance mechanosensitive channel
MGGIERIWAEANLAALVRAALVIVVSLVIARLLASLAGRSLVRASAQHRMLGRRVAFYSVLGLGLVSALHQLGFDLSTLLGAAGIVTVALGFAAQTSASNFIAGLFLIAEQPFVIGDVVRIGGTTGEVISVDMLSVKLRTFDNLFVRVPNESVVKSEVYNLTHFPIRRVDVMIGIAYDSDLSLVRKTLLDVAQADPLVLEDPKPFLLVQQFSASSIDVKLGAWCAREHVFEVQSRVHEKIKLAFERAGMHMPFPQTRIAPPGEPLPVTLVQAEKDRPRSA